MTDDAETVREALEMADAAERTGYVLPARNRFKAALLAFDRLAARLDAERWQPIETAPLNISILVFCPNTEHYGPGIWRAIHIDMGSGLRWHASTLHMARDIPPDYWPTHRLPLPTPPEAEG